MKTTTHTLASVEVFIFFEKKKEEKINTEKKKKRKTCGPQGESFSSYNQNDALSIHLQNLNKIFMFYSGEIYSTTSSSTKLLSGVGEDRVLN